MKNLSFPKIPSGLDTPNDTLSAVPTSLFSRVFSTMDPDQSIRSLSV